VVTPVEFRAIRKRLGLTQAEFGELLGVGRQQVNQVERGGENASLTLLRLAEAIGQGYRPTDPSR